jgi:hypothetical protein
MRSGQRVAPMHRLPRAVLPKWGTQWSTETRKNCVNECLWQKRKERYIGIAPTEAKGTRRVSMLDLGVLDFYYRYFLINLPAHPKSKLFFVGCARMKISTSPSAKCDTSVPGPAHEIPDIHRGEISW